jgi:Secretion system C-terminal sorting domain
MIRHQDINGYETESEAIQLFTVGRGSSIVCYPVPATDLLFVQSTQGLAISQVTLFDTAGRQVLHSASVASGLDVTTLSEGLYALHALTEDGRLHQTLVKVAR